MIVPPRGLAVEVTREMQDQLAQFAEELQAMNRRINLVSREDEDAIASRHLPHCLALAVRLFPENAVVCDWGTGGGLPLIPLAIVFPNVRFIGVDAVRKKTMAVETMARRIGLTNVTAKHARAEQSSIPHSISVSRATAPLRVLWEWHQRGLTNHQPQTDDAWSGLICLKGGDLQPEIDDLMQADPEAQVRRVSIADLFDDPYFATKEIVHVIGRSDE